MILAAGDSSCLGQPKQLLRINGKSLVRRIIDAASEAGCSPVVVVTGGDHQWIERELEETPVTVVQNRNWQRGIGSSIRIGMGALIKDRRFPRLAVDLPKRPAHLGGWKAGVP
jgi:molybdenum cofactor cytidylyltransferase